MNKEKVRNMKTGYLLSISIIIYLGSVNVLSAQHGAFIYGKVTTFNGNSYQGQIRWGNEETYWCDIFNSVKTRDTNLKYLSLDDRKEKNEGKKGLLGIDWKILSIWEDEYSRTNHQYSSQFGDIKSMEMRGSNRVRLTLKNGVELDLEGGSNDLGATINIYDFELGKIGLKWSRVERVDFSNTPTQLVENFGDPLYGVVRTTKKGSFEGLIWWDQDENIGTDKLDGDIKSEDISIEFSKINSIEKDGRGSQVSLYSGRQLFLEGSNDVNDKNRGITVSVADIGAVKIPWSDFVRLDFEKNPDLSAFYYNNFNNPIGITGTVKIIDNQNVTGSIIFDLDEAWELEMLEGDDDNIEYKIPFRNIKKIIPKNYNYSIIELKNGESLLLGDRRDVSESNDGVLVFKPGDEDPTHIRVLYLDFIHLN